MHDRDSLTDAVVIYGDIKSLQCNTNKQLLHKLLHESNTAKNFTKTYNSERRQQNNSCLQEMYLLYIWLVLIHVYLACVNTLSCSTGRARIKLI